MGQDSDRFAGFTDIVTSMDEIRAVIGDPKPQIVAKVIDHLSDICIDYIEKAPFLLIASANGQGRCDVSPKGDPAGFVRVLDEKRLVIPDRPGNRLAETFANLLENPYVGLLFLVPGKTETLRVSGEARIVRDTGLRESMAVDGRVPEFALAVHVERAQIHCPKCMIRSHLWQPEDWPDSAGLADVGVATYAHGKPDMTFDELGAMAQREGWDRLY